MDMDNIIVNNVLSFDYMWETHYVSLGAHKLIASFVLTVYEFMILYEINLTTRKNSNESISDSTELKFDI